MEIDHGGFERQINLPMSVDSARVTAEQNNGLLWIHLPWRTIAAPCKILGQAPRLRGAPPWHDPSSTIKSERARRARAVALHFFSEEEAGTERIPPAAALAPDPPVIAMTDKADGPNQPDIPGVLPILPIRGVVVFPGTVVPLTLGRPVRAQARRRKPAAKQDHRAGHPAQRGDRQTRPRRPVPGGRRERQVLKLMRQPDGTMVLLVQAIRRFRLGAITQTEPFLKAEVEVLPIIPAPTNDETQAAFNNLRESAVNLLDLSPEIPEQARLVLANIEDPATPDRPARGQPRAGRGTQTGTARRNRRGQADAHSCRKPSRARRRSPNCSKSSARTWRASFPPASAAPTCASRSAPSSASWARRNPAPRIRSSNSAHA